MNRFISTIVAALAIVFTAGAASAQQAYDISNLAPVVRSAAQAARDAQTLGIRAAARTQFGVPGTVTFTSNTDAAYVGEGFGSGLQVQRNGYGMIGWADGEYYAGQFVSAGSSTGSGDMHGYGVYAFADGRIYEGQWRNEQRHGYGVQWTPEGQVAFAGQWRNGEPVY